MTQKLDPNFGVAEILATEPRKIISLYAEVLSDPEAYTARLRAKIRQGFRYYVRSFGNPTGFHEGDVEDGYDVARVLPRKDNPFGWEFRCNLCRKMHRHGEGLGHRGSHCQVHVRDYILRPVEVSHV